VIAHWLGLRAILLCRRFAIVGFRKGNRIQVRGAIAFEGNGRAIGVEQREGRSGYWGSDSTLQTVCDRESG